MKNKEKLAKIATIIILIFVMICAIILCKYITGIELIQLKNNSDRQMMGYFIKTSKKENIIIDGGLKEDAPALIEHIKNNGGKVDFWLLTHPHEDHVGAFIDIVKNTDIPIKKIYVTVNSREWYLQYGESRGEGEAQDFIDVIENERIASQVEYVNINQKINIDNTKWEVLGVANPEITTNPMNNSSMVLLLKVHNQKILFLGDTGIESSEKLLKTQYDKLDADIVQVAHHGQSGATKDLYDRISPDICLWPTPDWLWTNLDGTGSFQTLEVRNWMEELGVSKHVVEKDGDCSLHIW